MGGRTAGVFPAKVRRTLHVLRGNAVPLVAIGAAAILAVVIVGWFASIAWTLLTLPRIPDRLVEAPPGMEVVHEYVQPGPEDGWGASREVTFTRQGADSDELVADLVTSLRSDGWQLTGSTEEGYRSTVPLDGDYVLRVVGRDASEPGVIAPTWASGQDNVLLEVETVECPRCPGGSRVQAG